MSVGGRGFPVCVEDLPAERRGVRSGSPIAIGSKHFQLQTSFGANAAQLHGPNTTDGGVPLEISSAIKNATERRAAGYRVVVQRVVIAGLGDTGVLTALKLAKRFEVTGISAKPGLLSGQELGVRVARPHEWARDYWTGFDRFRGLDRVRTVHGTLTGLDRKSTRLNSSH